MLQSVLSMVAELVLIGTPAVGTDVLVMRAFPAAFTDAGERNDLFILTLGTI